MRILAVTGPTRLAAPPDLPTAVGSDLPELSVTGQIGLLAPARTPPAIIEQVGQATRAALAEPGFRKLLVDAGMEATPNPGPETFRRALAADITLWGPVVKALGLKLD